MVLRRLLPLALLLTFSACNSAPLETKWRLRSFNVSTADLSQLRIAVRGPAWATFTPESTLVQARYWGGDDETSATVVTLRTQRGQHAGDAEALGQTPIGSGLVVFELAPQSLPAARQLQLETLRLKAQGPAHGKIHIGGSVACRLGDIPPGPIAIDAFVHADDESGWLPLYEQHDVRGDIRDARAEAELARLVPPCGERQGRARIFRKADRLPR